MAGRIHHPALSVVLFVAALLVFALDPASRLYPACPFQRVTGLLCPVCGSIRGVHALLHGHLLAALRCNALTVIFVLWVAGRSAFRLVTGRDAPMLRPRLPLIAAVVVVFSVARNVPVEAAMWLRPS